MTTRLSASALYNLKGLVALVTGGGTGIGLMIAQTLATNGAKVYIGGRREEVLRNAANEFNDRALSDKEGVTGKLEPLVMDVANKDSITQGVETIRSAEGYLNILVNNSGQVGPCSHFWGRADAPEQKDIGKAIFDNESMEEWASLFTVNISSIFFVTTAFISLLEAGVDKCPTDGSFTPTSSIINITSVSGIQRQAQGHFAYNVSKAGANHLTRLFATELAIKDKPIRVNAIAPGPFPTEMTESQGKTLSLEMVNLIGKGLQPVPAKRGGREEEVGATALYLASPQTGGYMNGQVLTIDGGFLTVNPGTA